MSKTKCRLLVRTCVFIVAALTGHWAFADVVVVVNRSDTMIEFELKSQSDPINKHKLAPGDLKTIPIRREAVLVCQSADPRESILDANSAYAFQRRESKMLELTQLALGEDERSRRGGLVDELRHRPSIKIIPVRLAVDDQERSSQVAWERRLRNRLRSANVFFEELFFVRFEVVSTQMWSAAPATASFDDAYDEFQKATNPPEGGIVIGFTNANTTETEVSPSKFPGPLQTHLLVREQIGRWTEAECLERLVHSLGHYFGAVHSPESTSVMRESLDDGRARSAKSQIEFDPVNALLVYLIAEEVRLRNVKSTSEMSESTQYRVRQLYQFAMTSFSDRSHASCFFQRMTNVRDEKDVPARTPSVVDVPKRVADTLMPVATSRSSIQTVIRAVVAEAQRFERQLQTELAAREKSPPAGDRLTQALIRAAADAAIALPTEDREHAFIVGIGIALDDSTVLQTNPLTAELCHTVETAEQRRQRIRLVQQATIFNRHDLVQHFAISGLLTAKLGRPLAEGAALSKEILDSHGGSGFSFVDLLADFTGIEFASALMGKELDLNTVSSQFRVNELVADVTDLPEGLSSESFGAKYGNLSDPRFRAKVADIQGRVRRELARYRGKKS